jgi:hypothetical protein
MDSAPSGDQPRTDRESSTALREFYHDILESLIKTFPGPREEAISTAVAYLQNVERNKCNSRAANQPRDTDTPALSSVEERQSGQVQRVQIRRSADVNLPQAKKIYP